MRMDARRIDAAEIALITGASSGIGRELARLFAADGSSLVLVARREDRLRALADELGRKHGTSAHVLPLDLAHPRAPEDLIAWTDANRVRIDVLVNNAGIGARGRFAAIDLQRQLDMLQVNVTALTHLTRLFLPGMLERRRGAILNVGSQAGFQPGPGMAVYYATKAYVLSLTEAIAEEVRGSGVSVTLLAPGATATEFAASAGMEGSRVFRTGVMGARSVARAGYRGMRRGDVLVIPGAKGKLTASAVRLMPRAFVRRVVHALQR
jgi:uncharacterized protein